MRRNLALALMLAMVFATLSGCASKYGEQKTVVNYYPSCYAPIQDLRNREHDVAKGTAAGAAVGALGGALVGFLSSGGDWRGAVAGAAVGGVSGGVAGNIYASKQKEMDDNKRLASYLQDIDGDISGMDITAAAARRSLQCYDQQFKVLVADIKARTISRTVASQRFAEISNGREEAIAILGDLVAQGNNLSQQYEQAFVQEEQDISRPQKASAGKATASQKRSAIKTARKRTQTLKKKTQEIAQEKLQAQEVSSQQTVAINNIISDLEDARS